MTMTNDQSTARTVPEWLDLARIVPAEVRGEIHDLVNSLQDFIELEIEMLVLLRVFARCSHAVNARLRVADLPDDAYPTVWAACGLTEAQELVDLLTTWVLDARGDDSYPSTDQAAALRAKDGEVGVT